MLRAQESASFTGGTNYQSRTRHIEQKIGTRAWVMLFMSGGDEDDPLFLQVKEEDASVLEPYFGQSPYTIHGKRVV